MSGLEAVAPSATTNARFGRGQLLAGLAAEPDPERAPERLRPEVDEHDRADDARHHPHGLERQQPRRAPAAPGRGVQRVDDRDARADRQPDPRRRCAASSGSSSSDIGPSWAATDAPRPNPISRRGDHGADGTAAAAACASATAAAHRIRTPPPTAPSSEQREPDPGGPRREAAPRPRAKGLEPAAAGARAAARRARARRTPARRAARRRAGADRERRARPRSGERGAAGAVARGVRRRGRCGGCASCAAVGRSAGRSCRREERQRVDVARSGLPRGGRRGAGRRGSAPAPTRADRRARAHAGARRATVTRGQREMRDAPAAAAQRDDARAPRA